MPKSATLPLLLLIATLLALASVSLQADPAPPDLYKDIPASPNFPPTLGDFRKTTTLPYQTESGKQGIAVNYEGPDSLTTIYVRPLDPASSKTAEDYTKEALASVEGLQKQGTYTDFKVVPLLPQSQWPGWATAAFTARNGDTDVLSAILCQVTDGTLLKIRCSSRNSNQMNLAASLEQLRPLFEKK